MSTTSLSRAFTSRRIRMSNDLSDSSKMPQRSNTTKAPQNLRHKISAPMQLVHTTNMLSYNAPDLPRTTRSNSTNSKSDEDSDVPYTAHSTPPTSPDVSPGEALSVQPNHLSTYFVAPGKPFTAAATVKLEAPVIPKRSPSHTKKNSYDAIARQRSISRMSKDSDHSLSTKASSTFSRSSSTSTTASLTSRASASRLQKQAVPPMPATMLVAPPPPAPITMHQQLTQNDPHPFGQELAQVTELAEEYGVKGHMKSLDDDDEYLETRGLAKWSPSEYLSEIQSLTASFFPESLNIKPAAPLWI